MPLLCSNLLNWTVRLPFFLCMSVSLSSLFFLSLNGRTEGWRERGFGVALKHAIDVQCGAALGRHPAQRFEVSYGASAFLLGCPSLGLLLHLGRFSFRRSLLVPCALHQLLSVHGGRHQPRRSLPLLPQQLALLPVISEGVFLPRPRQSLPYPFLGTPVLSNAYRGR